MFHFYQKYIIINLLKIFKKSSSIDFCYATNYLLKSQIINKNNISEVEIHEKKTLFYALLNPELKKLYAPAFETLE